MYAADVSQRDCEEYAERLTFAINTIQNRVKNETLFYLVDGWDATSTLEATLPVESIGRGRGGTTYRFSNSELGRR